jgi:hypothetical protein
MAVAISVGTPSRIGRLPLAPKDAAEGCAVR